jgi:RimJ/RimL family protein N-acetyltransferase
LDLNTIFETKRLILRPMNINDAQGLFSYLSDPEVMRFDNSGVLTYKQVEKFLKEKQKKIMHDMLPLGARAVVLKESGDMIGECTLQHLVMGRGKAASQGRGKTGHFEKDRDRRVHS